MNTTKCIWKFAATNLGIHWVNTLRPRQDGRRFPDDTFEHIFLKENVIILIKISLKFVPKGPIINIPALVQIMAWRRSGDKPLSEPMMVSLPTHICVTRPQWVNKQEQCIVIHAGYKQWNFPYQIKHFYLKSGPEYFLLICGGIRYLCYGRCYLCYLTTAHQQC